MRAYRVASQYALLALARNRLAMILLIGFIPLWITLTQVLITRQPLVFRQHAAGDLLHAGSEKVAMISGSLNAVALLMGFMMFSAAHHSSQFDRRLVAAGYPRVALLLAKLTALCVAAIVVSTYATLWMLVEWSANQPLLLACGVLAGALVYGTIGLFLALFLPGELEGMVAIIMTSVIDLVPQNPLTSAASDSALVQLLPSYGAMQTCLSAGFGDSVAWSPLTGSLAWTGVMALVALAAFTVRTRGHLPIPTTVGSAA